MTLRSPISRRLAFLVLRVRADRRELEDAVLLADARLALDHDVRADARAAADRHARPDHRVRADLDAFGEHRVRRHDGGGVDDGRHPGITIISALATSLPSTVATVLNFQIVRMRRSSFALSTTWSPGTTGRRKRALSMPAK